MALIKGDNQHNTLKGGENNDALFGFDGIDFLYGYGGDDWLNGGLGIDKLSGGAGNDTYSVDSQYDSIIERPDAGIDTVRSSVDWTLAPNEENLFLTGIAALNGNGNSANNAMTGNVAANTLYGNDGDDTLDGRAGVDLLSGGNGNDLLKIRDVNGDRIVGGSGADVLEVYGSNQHIDLSVAGSLIYSMENIKFSGAGHNVLTLTHQNVLGLGNDSDTLTIDGDTGDTVYLNVGGWLDGGIQGTYHLYTQQGATVKVNTAMGDIVADVTPSYTIHGVSSAEQVGRFFTDEAENIVIDFGGKRYSSAGIATIDLTGFGLEDTLVVALHDGLLGNRHPADYGSGANYIEQSTFFFSAPDTYEFGYRDRVSWKIGANTAKLVSSLYYNTSGASQVLGSIQITCLPTGLPDSQFIFV